MQINTLTSDHFYRLALIDWHLPFRQRMPIDRKTYWSEGENLTRRSEWYWPSDSRSDGSSPQRRVYCIECTWNLNKNSFRKFQGFLKTFNGFVKRFLHCFRRRWALGEVSNIVKGYFRSVCLLERHSSQNFLIFWGRHGGPREVNGCPWRQFAGFWTTFLEV